MLSGRLKAAMILAGISPYSPKEKPHRILVDYLKTKGVEVNRQTAHNWFRPQSHSIDCIFLFKIADILGVSARWLATGQKPIKRQEILKPEYEQPIGVWNALAEDEPRQTWLRNGQDLLTLLHKTSRSNPFAVSDPPKRKTVAESKR